jgi:hypothetical protein
MPIKSESKTVPSHSVAKRVTVEWVVVEIAEGVHLMEAGTRYGRVRECV